VRCIGVIDSVVILVVVLQVGDWKIALWSGRGRAGFDRGFDTVYCVDEEC
jgi:hypothetical protein